ncbi:hypothetical protein NECAME_02096, partial [Necator americanus]
MAVGLGVIVTALRTKRPVCWRTQAPRRTRSCWDMVIRLA